VAPKPGTSTQRRWLSASEWVSSHAVATEQLLLEELVLLTERVSALRNDWAATPADEEVLRLAAAVTGKPLAPETFDVAPSALAFLLGARFSLERRLQRKAVRTHSLLG
jgi:hypothetical protein